MCARHTMQRKSGAAGTTQRKLGLPVACLHGSVEGRSPCYLAMEEGRAGNNLADSLQKRLGLRAAANSSKSA